MSCAPDWMMSDERDKAWGTRTSRKEWAPKVAGVAKDLSFLRVAMLLTSDVTECRLVAQIAEAEPSGRKAMIGWVHKR